MRCPNCESQVSPNATQCDRCGEDIPSGQHFLEESGVVEPAPVKPSRQATTPARNERDYRFASLGDRFLAFVFDLIILFGVFAVIDAWTFMRWSRFEGAEMQLTTAALLVAIILNATVLFLYEWLLEATFGATLGKILVGIRVVGSEGRAFFSACAFRNLLRIVDGLGFYVAGALVAACSNVHQRIGDFFAGTAVVEENFGTGLRVAAAVLFLAILGGAGWAVPRVCAVDRSVQNHHLDQVIVRVGKTSNSAYVRVAGLSVNVQTTNTH
ncbi:MAG TPA: RDD family protein [Terriglobales bacterium]|nr:RDD family protein [Terriglobales bacterium]